MPRRAVYGAIAIVAFAVAAAACGGGGDSPDDTSGVADSGADRPLTANTPPPIDTDTSPTLPGDASDTPRPSATSETLQPGSATPPRAPGSEYIVQEGDTLFDIAVTFDTTFEEILALNSLLNPNALDVGQVIFLPASPDFEEDETVADVDTPEAEVDSDETNDGAAADSEDGNQPAADDAPPAIPDGAGTTTGTSPSGIPQPGLDVTFEQVPDQPDAFATYGATALPWLHDKTDVTDLIELFTSWPSPAIGRGDRLNLVDTDLDGRASLVIVYTNPATFGESLTGSNLVIYDPVPGRPDRYQIAYDHNLRSGRESTNIGVLLVENVTSDGLPEVTFVEETCGASTCISSFHSLTRSGDGYRDIVTTPIDISTVTAIDVSDQTGDGVRDLGIEGGVVTSAAAGPPRVTRFVYSATSGSMDLVRSERAPSPWLVWAIVDANAAFDGGDDGTAITLYDRALSDSTLEEWMTGETVELFAIARLRRALALSRSGQDAAAIAAAQSAASGAGLIAELSLAFLSGFAGEANLTAGCAAFNSALAPRQSEWTAFWRTFGTSVPAFAAGAICPF